MTVNDEELGRRLRDVLTQEADTMDIDTHRAHRRFQQEIAATHPSPRRTILIAAAAVLALIVAGGIGWAWFGGDEDTTSEPAGTGVVVDGPALLDIRTGATTPLELSLPTDLTAEDEDLLGDLGAAWIDVSGDGSTVAWRIGDRIAIVGLDDAEPHVVSVVEGSNPAVATSPDGSAVAVVEDSAIVLVDAVTGEKTVVHQPQGGPSLGALFLRGEDVFFSLDSSAGDGPPAEQLWRVPLAGGDPVLVQPDAFPFDVSADGTMLAFGRAAGPEQFLSSPPEAAAEPIMLETGGGSTTVLGSTYGVPLFSPDGTRLLYAETGTVLDRESGAMTEIPEDSGWRIRDWVDGDTVLVTPGS